MTTSCDTWTCGPWGGRYKYWLCLFAPWFAIAIANADVANHQPLPAFPGAEGFGALATGGRGGEIDHVTDLADSGPGSLREALSAPHRMVVFDVSGVIRLKSNLKSSSDVTILGQTAPGDGITVYGHSISFSGCSNVIVRYIRFREGIGGDRGKCSVNVANGGDMIFDHVSIEWGRWDCLGLTEGTHDITVQNCLIGQGVAPQRFGALVDSVERVTLSCNLWIDNKSRNPKAKGTIQYINNVIYNWGVNGLVGGHSESDHQLDAVGNYFISGPNSNGRFVGMFTATDHVFQRGNCADLNRNGKLDGRLISDEDFAVTGGNASFAGKPFLSPAIPVAVKPAKVAFQKVEKGAGCSLHRDAVDEQLIAELRSLGQQGRLVRSELELGALHLSKEHSAVTNSSSDNVVGKSKSAHRMASTSSRAAENSNSENGYTALENYANKLVTGNP